ncbi:hypothetical protein ACTZWW_04320 [Salinarimonas sp. NSM]|uniref:hypothetical protein n=1 Tax=Salinarimonas sp. NSM TaxID=3458003 RepID=UPI004036AF26
MNGTTILLSAATIALMAAAPRVEAGSGPHRLTLFPTLLMPDGRVSVEPVDLDDVFPSPDACWRMAVHVIRSAPYGVVVGDRGGRLVAIAAACSAVEPGAGV